MSDGYRHYEKVTREILDEVKVGDLIKVNDWETSMVVRGVSPNYFVMAEEDGERYYSVVSKLPWNGIRHNDMVGGMFHCGPDNWTFGHELCFEDADLYYFLNPETTAKYLQSFEDGESHISERRGTAIRKLYIKRKEATA